MKTAKIGPIYRDCSKRVNSSCDTADLHSLDWKNWFSDNSFGGFYIHVKRVIADEGETWHRVYPKRIKGRLVNRVAVRDGWPQWLHDEPEPPSPKPQSN